MNRIAGEFREETRKEIKKIQPSTIDHMTHDIVNHLTIISLCCCELRSSLGAKLESGQLNEFKRIESAVQEAAEKIQQLKAIAQAHPPTCDDKRAELVLNREKREDPLSYCVGSLYLTPLRSTT